MTVRTTKKTLTFANPFLLGDFDEVLPPGAYDVETDEELLEGLSFLAYRRILTLIHLPAKPGHRGLSRTLTIDPNELDAALKRDEALAIVRGDRGDWNAVPKAPAKRTVARRNDADRRAVERAENEGMIGHPYRRPQSCRPKSAPARNARHPGPTPEAQGTETSRRPLGEPGDVRGNRPAAIPAPIGVPS